VAQRLGRGIALLFHDRGTRRGWVDSSTPRPHFTPGKDPVPILQEAGLAPGPVWTAGKSRPHRDSIPDRPARSQSLYRLSYRAQQNIETHRGKNTLFFPVNGCGTYSNHFAWRCRTVKSIEMHWHTRNTVSSFDHYDYIQMHICSCHSFIAVRDRIKMCKCYLVLYRDREICCLCRVSYSLKVILN